MRVNNPDALEWYKKEAADQNWSVRALQRQVNSLYYDRLRMNNDSIPALQQEQGKTTILAHSSHDFIKDSYVLEFLDIPTVGIILCTEKDQTVVKYSILEES